MERARVKWFNVEKAYGYLEIPGQPDLWFHLNDRRIRCYQCSGTTPLELKSIAKPSTDQVVIPCRTGGQWIVYELGQSTNQKPKADRWDYADTYDWHVFSVLRRGDRFEEQSLLEVIGAVDMTDFCVSRERRYLNWEKESATPALEAKGLTVVDWFTVESDSFGPLVRAARVYDGHGARILSYG